jgi:large conductance mechanosensitive channel
MKKVKKVFDEFKQFAVKGNMIDLAIGVIIGTAFNGVVKSLVDDVIMPPIGALIGGIKFDAFKLVLREQVLDSSGVVLSQAVSLNYGAFIQILFNFLIIALTVFMVVKVMNKLKKAEEKKEEKSAPLSKEAELLTDIKAILQKKGI